MNKLPRPGSRLGVAAFATMLVLGALALSAASALAAPDSHRKSEPVGAGYAVPANAQEQTEAYWTPARMASATDADVIAAKAPSGLTSPAVSTPDGPAGAVAGTLPGRRGTSSPAATAEPIPQAFSYPFPYDAFPVPTKAYKEYPYRLNGKIFFTNAGSNYVCSGTSVYSSTHTSQVWAAGHCSANTGANTKGGVFDSFAEFVPAYNGNGKTLKEEEPFGVFVANYFYVSTSWLNSADFREDFSTMLVNDNEKKKTLSKAVGSAGFAWNFSANEQFVTFGYPAASPYTGNTMEEDLAATAVSDTGIGGSGAAPTGIGSPFTGGASGGAWYIDWSPASAGYINGHNDYKYGEQPEAIYSPYYNENTDNIRCLGSPPC